MKGEDSEEGSLSGGSWQCSSLEAVRVKKREQSKSRKARLVVKKKKSTEFGNSLDEGNRAKGARLKSSTRVSPEIQEKLGRLGGLI